METNYDRELSYPISREKFEPEPGLELGPPDWDSGSNFTLEIW